VYVPEAHCRQGMSAALYRRVVQLARGSERGVGLRLYVERDNERARRTDGALGTVNSGPACSSASSNADQPAGPVRLHGGIGIGIARHQRRTRA
jgi:hypothetical protein